MTRLTKDIRDRMARKLVAHRYTDEAKEINYQSQALADRAYALCYPKSLLAAMKVVEQQYPKTFEKSHRIRVAASGFDVELGARISSKWVRIPTPTDLPVRMLVGSYHKHIITDEALIAEVKEYAQRTYNFNEGCKTAFYEALSVLNGISTGKKLAEAWPEAIPVIGDLIPEDSRTLPVVQVSAINAKFKLPPETKAKK